MLCLHTLSLLCERSGTKFKEAKQNTLVHECRVCFSFHIGRFSLTNCLSFRFQGIYIELFLYTPKFCVFTAFLVNKFVIGVYINHPLHTPAPLRKQWVYTIFPPAPPALDRKQCENGLIHKFFRVYTHFHPLTPYLNKKSLATSCAQTQNITKLSKFVYIIKNANAAIPNITHRNPITTSIGLNIILTADQ